MPGKVAKVSRAGKGQSAKGAGLFRQLADADVFVNHWESAKRPNKSPTYDGPSVVRQFKANVKEYVQLCSNAVAHARKK